MREKEAVTCVGSLVYLEGIVVRGGKVADITDVRLLTRVYSTVVVQIIDQCKGLQIISFYIHMPRRKYYGQVTLITHLSYSSLIKQQLGK